MKSLAFLIALLVGSLLTTSAHAQEAEQESFKLEVIQLVADAPPELYYRSPDGNYERLKISTRNRGNFNLVQRLSPLTLYRKVTVDGETTMEPAFTVPLPIEDEQAMLFFHLDQSGKAQFQMIEDSPGRHAGGTVRILNLTGQDIACLISDRRVGLKPNADLIEDVSSDKKRFSFTYALLEPKPYKSPTKTLPMRGEGKRLLIVFSSHKRQVPGETSDAPVTVIVPDATRMYDRVRN